MLLSMTGYGEGRCQAAGLDIAAELRSINNRHLKLTVRVTEGFGGWEPLLEDYLRQRLRRGTVQLNLRVRRQATPDDYRINLLVLQSYADQLAELGDRPPISSLLILPGVVETGTAATMDLETTWPLAQQAVDGALEQFELMRQREGASMQRDMLGNLERIEADRQLVARRSPVVVAAYQQRLTERVKQALAEHDVTVEPGDLLREVSLFADRVDIAEELVRLESHLHQAEKMIAEPESPGRKMDFLIQEMFRETNTIGSKANDAEIARHVVDMKTTIERMREMIQNVE